MTREQCLGRMIKKAQCRHCTIDTDREGERDDDIHVVSEDLDLDLIVCVALVGDVVERAFPGKRTCLGEKGIYDKLGRFGSWCFLGAGLWRNGRRN
jgi:hypothetical protein